MSFSRGTTSNDGGAVAAPVATTAALAATHVLEQQLHKAAASAIAAAAAAAAAAATTRAFCRGPRHGQQVPNKWFVNVEYVMVFGEWGSGEVEWECGEHVV
jgi:hypothetical protein